MKETQTEVLVVGAGPTGLALGCDLARRGVKFRLVDKALEYFIGSKGKGLQPRTLEVMDDLGIVDEVLALGKFHVPFRAYDTSGKAVGELDLHAGRNPTPSTPYASSMLLPQWRTEERLRALLERSGGRVELGTELVDLAQDDDGVSATLRTSAGDEIVRCKYLVASDGGKSFVRKHLAVPFEGETWKDERMYVGDVRLTGLDREAWHSWRDHPDGWLALCPLPSTDEYQIQIQIQPDEEREPSLEIFREIVKQRAPGNAIELTEAPWTSLYRANVRMVSKYRIGRVFLAGDAAHVHSPAGGQGMNTGIQDAYNLGWKLGAVLRGADPSLLDTYEEERLPVAASVLGISSALHKAIASTDEKSRRDAVTLQLGITYAAMRLAQTDGASTLKIAAGDRCPDAPGEGARIFDMLRGPEFVLLRMFPAEADAIDATKLGGVKRVDVVAAASGKAAKGVTEFIDKNGHARDAYGGNGEYLLVRPDGYAGWAGRDVAQLYKYLNVVRG